MNTENTENKYTLELVKQVDFNNVSENTVLFFKINNMAPEGLIETLQTLHVRYGKMLRDKNITVIVIDKETDISLLDEKSMEKYGWEKKNKSKIITLDKLV